ncbi:hypothetical protein ACFYKX_11360 [Cytobacillus sp. FJAT-54145]|uniref:Uncharacterized protein n=1 Tax=Cytobacillus spartinae TaxID=3299023 RepID=A0ABW6KE73_9BACI
MAKSRKLQNFKINGYKFPQGLKEKFEAVKKNCGIQITSTAYATFLTILFQRSKENNPKGIVKEYRLTDWESKSGVKYDSLHAGLEWLMDHQFIEEMENPHGRNRVFRITDWEKYDTPERTKENPNYFRVPYTLFETDFLAEAVRTSNPTMIELLFNLLNQFRVKIKDCKTRKQVDAMDTEFNMNTLKQMLRKKAVDVRAVLTYFESFFGVEFLHVHTRGLQLWVKKIKFTLKYDCVKENTDEFELSPLQQKLHEELVHFLDYSNMKYRPVDVKQVMVSFKQEVMKHMTRAKSEDGSYLERDRIIKDFFIRTLDEINERIHKVTRSGGIFHVRTIGNYFRKAFRERYDHNAGFTKEEHALLGNGRTAEYEATGTKVKAPGFN